MGATVAAQRRIWFRSGALYFLEAISDLTANEARRIARRQSLIEEFQRLVARGYSQERAAKHSVLRRDALEMAKKGIVPRTRNSGRNSCVGRV